MDSFFQSFEDPSHNEPMGYPFYDDQGFEPSGSYYLPDDREVQPFMVPPAAIDEEFRRGRAGHFYRTRLTSFNQMMTIQLLSYSPQTGMVTMNVWVPWERRWIRHQEHFTGLNGLTYLGPRPPQGVPSPPPPGPPRPPRPWWCGQFPWHPACWSR
ncbi:MAG: hypothetical protein ABF586_01620 [Sporolactobacillus sp.]